MAITLKVVCDDSGLSRGVDSAILQLYTQGIASAASIMPNMPQTETSFSRFAAHSNLELGAHLTLTQGKPLTSAITQTGLVAADGNFSGRMAILGSGLWVSAKDKAAIYTELDAQMAQFSQAGIDVAHITTHHHFHALPVYQKMVLSLAKSYAVEWVRNPDLRRAIVPQNFLLDRCQQKPNLVPMPDYLILIQAWVGRSPRELMTELTRLEGMIEVVVHPALLVDHTFPSDVAYTPAGRVKEVYFIEKFFAMLEPFIGDFIHIV